MLQFVIFALTVLVVLAVALCYLFPGSRKVTTVPGPIPIDDLEGNLPDITASGSLHEFLAKLHETYGPIVSFWYGPKLVVSTASPELFKEQSHMFDRPALLFQLYQLLLTEHSVQYCNGAEGRLRHSTYAKFFSHENMSNYTSQLQQLAGELVQGRLTKAAKTQQHIPLYQYMFAFAIKASLWAAFGVKMKDDRAVWKFHQAYEQVFEVMEEKLKLGRIELSDEQHDVFEKNKDYMYEVVHSLLAERKSAGSSDGAKGDSDYRMLDGLIDLKMDDAKMDADCLTLLVAGFHTSGLLLTWSLYYLALHPDVQDRVVAEIESVIGGSDFSMKAFDELVYMRQVFDETLRCSVLAPFAARVQDVDIELGGHKITAGTPVVQALGVTLMDEKLWPDPERFDPDRFSADNRSDVHHFAFVPFGFAGGRKCPGWRFSLVEAAVLLCTLLPKFKVALVPGQTVIRDYGLVTKPQDEIWITLSAR